MPKGESLRKKRATKPRGDYDYLKEIVKMARKNGWDLEELGLIPRELPVDRQPVLTKKQADERNRLVKSILQRFARLLRTPVPAELEADIRSKEQDSWLPWEQEAIDRIDNWRNQVNEIKPEIVDQIKKAWENCPEDTK